jgi:putative endopeptidase
LVRCAALIAPHLTICVFLRPARRGSPRSGLQSWPMSHVDALDLSLIDDAVSPGDDFFRFANGGWLAGHPVPPEYGSWGSFHEVQERNEELLHGLLKDAAQSPTNDAAAIAGAYFASGMAIERIEESGMEPLAPDLERMAAVSNAGEMCALAAALHPHGVSILFGLYVAPDFDDSDRYLLFLSQGGLGLPERDYYLRDDERSFELRDLYRSHVAAQLVNLGEIPAEAERNAAGILELETALAGESFTAAQLRDIDLTTNKIDRTGLTTVMPGFDLNSYLELIGAGDVTAVNVDNPEFFKALDRLLAETPVDILRAYARWHLVRATASSLTSVFEDEAFSFYGTALGGQQKQKERWKRVLAAATREIGEPVARLYVDAAFSASAKARCEELVSGLVVSMRYSIESLTWMGDTTKQMALEKLSGFTYKIGFPDRWKGTQGLEMRDEPWAANRLAARSFEFVRQVEKLAGPVDASEWAMPAHVVNAYYHPTRNEIVFPAGILQPPFFHADGDDAVNFGAIGTVIGHEITHGFDDQGSRFDATGRLRDWWADHDKAEFERRADIVVSQFDGFAIDDDLNVNGRLTLGENIADLGGVSIAFDAFKRIRGDGAHVGGYSPEQRFFLSYGAIWRHNYTDEYLRLLVNTDPHAPAMFRCNGALANIPAFAEAFGLDEDAPMRRRGADRAEIW